MLASRNGNVAVIARLLAAGADVNAREDLRGTTPLMWAADQGHAAALKVLIEHGADVAAQSKTVETVHTLLVYQTIRLKGNSVLAKRFAARPGNHLEDPDPYSGALTPLAFAVRRNALDAVRVLLAAGAGVNGLTGAGWSPLLIAIENRYYRLAMFLIDNGADPNARESSGLDAAVPRGRQPQHRAGRLPLAEARSGSPGGDHGAARPRRQRQRARERQHVDSHHLHRSVAVRGWRHRVSPGRPVERPRRSCGCCWPVAPTRRSRPPLNVTALMVASGIGWVEGITHEWSERDNIETVKLCLELGTRPQRGGRRWPNGIARCRT